MTGLVGTGGLIRLALRRDRVLLPVWIAVFVAMAAGSASATVGIYPTVQSRVDAAEGINNTPSLVALYGAIYDPTSLGALAVFKLGGFGAVMVGLLAIFITIRHTRAEEESGRLELLGATVVGRYAPLTAALIVATGANLVLGLLTALSLIAYGLPAAGSLAFGLAWAASGIVFAAVAGVAAQLTESARTAIGLTAGAIGFFYLVRAIGDTGPGWLSWLSPIGWAQQIRPFAGNRWVVFGLPLAFAALVVAGAYALVARRDLGAGLVPTRPGPATASPRLRSPLALAWRLQRNALFGWAAGFLVLGAVLGSIAANVGDMLDSPSARDLITKLGGVKALSDAFLATDLGIAGVVASAYGIQAAMRLRSEETELRAEPLLATSVSRTRWAGSHLVIGLGGTFFLMLVGGLSAGLVHAAQTGDGAQVGRVLGAALVQVPAAWVLTGLVLAVFGLMPRAIVAGWLALVVFLLLGQFGPLFKLNQAVMDLSPYAHVPRLPGGSFSALPLVLLTAVAAALIGVGLAGFRRRDVG